jgi:uncharacterized protein YjbI with pentapeptide repeats
MEERFLASICRRRVTGTYQLSAENDQLMDRDFQGILFENCIIKGGDFASSSFLNCTFKNVQFSQTDLMAVTFTQCDCSHLVFSHCSGDFSIQT